MRKSSLCWFFSQKKSRLPTDRIFRVRGEVKEHQKEKLKRPRKTSSTETGKRLKGESNKNQRLEISEDVPQSDSSTGSITDPEESYQHSTSSKVSIKLEKYYAVYYDSGWYIGRIIKHVNTNTYLMKFLEVFLESYSWPKKDDIQEVEKKFKFFWPS